MPPSIVHPVQRPGQFADRLAKASAIEVVSKSEYPSSRPGGNRDVPRIVGKEPTYDHCRRVAGNGLVDAQEFPLRQRARCRPCHVIIADERHGAILSGDDPHRAGPAINPSREPTLQDRKVRDLGECLRQVVASPTWPSEQGRCQEGTTCRRLRCVRTRGFIGPTRDTGSRVRRHRRGDNGGSTPVTCTFRAKASLVGGRGERDAAASSEHRRDRDGRQKSASIAEVHVLASPEVLASRCRSRSRSIGSWRTPRRFDRSRCCHSLTWAACDLKVPRRVASRPRIRSHRFVRTRSPYPGS